MTASITAISMMILAWDGDWDCMRKPFKKEHTRKKNSPRDVWRQLVRRQQLFIYLVILHVKIKTTMTSPHCAAGWYKTTSRAVSARDPLHVLHLISL